MVFRHTDRNRAVAEKPGNALTGDIGIVIFILIGGLLYQCFDDPLLPIIGDSVFLHNPGNEFKTILACIAALQPVKL